MVGFPGGSDSKESTCNAEDLGSIPGGGRSPGEGNSNPLQYSCLGNPKESGPWRATVHNVAELDTTELLIKWTCTQISLVHECAYINTYGYVYAYTHIYPCTGVCVYTSLSIYFQF